MLPDGARLHVAIPDVTQRHWAVNMRKFVVRASHLADLATLGTLYQQATRFLEAAVAAGLNILVAGGTQAEKTTLSNRTERHRFPEKAAHNRRQETRTPGGDPMDTWSGDVSRARRVGVLVWAVALGMIAWLSKPPWGAQDWVLLGVAALAIALVWWILVVRPVAAPDGNTPALVGLLSGIIAFPASAFYYFALPLVLGSVAAVLGLEGRRRARAGAGRGRMALAAIVIGGLAIVGWILTAIDGSANHSF